MVARCKRAAAEHYANMGSPHSLSIADLQRKHCILHRTSLVRMIDKMKDKAVSVPSATPLVRLTQDEVAMADLNRPGTLKTLLKKLHRSYEVGSGQKRRAPGKACTRCHRSKKSCSGFPCSNCLFAGATCIKDQGGCAAELSILQDTVQDRSPTLKGPEPMPLSWGRWAHTFDPEPPISQGTMQYCSPTPQAPDPMRPSLGAIGLLLDFAWKPDILAGMIGSCPQKLRCALDRLSCVIKPMLRAQAAKRKPLPELDTEIFESVKVARSRVCMQQDGSTKLSGNCRLLEIYGVHKEELAARLGRRDMPMWHTEYRMLAWQLEFLYQTCFNESGSFDIFLPLRQNCFELDAARAAGKHLDDRWIVNRWRFVLHANGYQSTFVSISAEEFDHAVAQHADALGRFAECSFSGRELHRTPDLYEREKVASLVTSEEGRRMLDALADHVVRYFRLEEPPELEPVPSFALALPSGQHLHQ